MKARQRRRPPVSKPIAYEKHGWSNTDLDNVVKSWEAQPGLELYWSQGDGLSKEQLKLLIENENGVEEVSDRIWQYNLDESDRLGEERIEEILTDMRKKGPVTAKTERRLRARLEDSEALCVDLNLSDLARGTSDPYCTVKLPEEFESTFQAYRGIRDVQVVSEMLKFCELLCVSPHHLQPLVDDSFDYRFPMKLLSEEPYVDASKLLAFFGEVTYGGTLVAICAPDAGDFVDYAQSRKWFHNRLVARKGTQLTYHCYVNGATTCDELVLLRDLVLPEGSYLHYDDANKYGVQSCCACTREYWTAGSVEPTEEPDPKRGPES